MTARPGTVYLVGAGPGDPGLITRRGLELVRSADVILFDRLVAPALLAEARPGAELVFVGKRPGEVHSRQVVADALLLSKAREGRSVVRLKGGDPFVFGRGAEEARLLAESDVDFEIVPGVTSAIAVPAYAGIPATERGVASSFAVVTARAEDSGEPRWPSLAAAADTLILLMGVDALDGVTGALIEGGRSPDEPAATIEWGTTAAQRTVVGVLSDIAGRAREAGLGPPATTVIGRVVATRETIAWFERRPLLGRTVVVTRAADRAGRLADALHELGAQVLPVPVIAVGDPTDRGPLERAVKEIDAYAWIVFTSVTGVVRFFEALGGAGNDARALARSKVASVGEVTAASLVERGIRPDLVSPRGTASALAGELPPGRGRVLWPRAEDAPEGPVRQLRERGWTVDEVPAYRTVPGAPPGAIADIVRSGETDVITFTSASTVRNFVTLVGGPEQVGAPGAASGPAVVCIGPETASAARAAGFEVAAVADPHTSEGLLAAIVDVLASGR